MEDLQFKADLEIKNWFSILRNAKLNRNVDHMIAEMSPGLNQLADAKIATFVYDFRQSNYRYFNAYFPQIFQVNEEKIRQEGFQFMQSVTHPEDFLKCLYVTKQAVIEFSRMKDVEQQSSLFRLFFRIRRPNDSWVWVMQSNRTYTDDDQQLAFNVGFLVELFGNQHPFKVIGVLETNGRTIDIIPDLGTEKLSLLSYREMEILQLIKSGLSSKEVGQKLNITENTVKAHRKNMLKKLEVRNMFQATSMLDNL
jgi:DNA-binding CsgD family transcriptional regulator